ncbi:acetylxylan esterase [Leucothrix mucor]|uniref:acetylxylan esterase n=1 Tax=Leucothrix mucor TaxID=45248 RepID=UPI0003B36D30|nr:acetylxylan esterase [Leucothrix mucor]
MTAFAHSYDFDPSYGYTKDDLLAIRSPAAPSDFAWFWQERYQRATALHPHPRIRHTGASQDGYEIYSLRYFSTDSFVIRGWVLIPQDEPVTKGIVIGHGYGGRDEPDYTLKQPGAALMFPCFRGLSRSQKPGISTNPAYHVLHDIDKPKRYILGGCVEDVWMAVSAMQILFPPTKGHIGYAGISFGGGIGAMAVAWDERIQRAHLNVPTFGDNPLRLGLKTIGSGEAVQHYQLQHGNALETLQYYDAASAAQFIKQPMHIAAALFDPAVAPPGQFAIYNALPEEKSLTILEAGHFDYPNEAREEQALIKELDEFFSHL